MLDLNVALRRGQRQKCSNCGLRRVVFYIGVNGTIRSAVLCGPCLGIRERRREPKSVHPDQVGMFE